MNEEKEYKDFMIKMVQKSFEINNDFRKLSPNNQMRVNQEMQMLFNAMYVNHDIIMINRFRDKYVK